KLTVALDAPEAVEHIATAARDADRPVSVYVELDLGMHRVGTQRVDEAIALAQRIRECPPLEFEGIAFYPGHIRSGVDQQAAQLEALSSALRSALDAFERADLRPAVVSGGSTPTLWHTHELYGVTELRPGTYV